MAQRLKYFLVVLLLILTKENFGQINIEDYKKSNLKSNTYSRFLSYIKSDLRHDRLINIASHPSITLNPILKTYYTSTLSFICKREYIFEKRLSVPLRLRVGSLDYTNYLEQKPNAVKPVY